jgi:hypothetical protein
MGRYDVYRDKNGKPVTITEEQMTAIWHAVHVVDRVRKDEDEPAVGQGFGQPPNDQWKIDLYKSRLLGRMLIDGRPPLDAKPGHWQGGCAYHEVEPDLDHYYMGAPLVAVRHPDGSLEPIEPIRPAAALRRWRKLVRRRNPPAS